MIAGRLHLIRVRSEHTDSLIYCGPEKAMIAGPPQFDCRPPQLQKGTIPAMIALAGDGMKPLSGGGAFAALERTPGRCYPGV